jgi:hypothetical protein
MAGRHLALFLTRLMLPLLLLASTLVGLSETSMAETTRPGQDTPQSAPSTARGSGHDSMVQRLRQLSFDCTSVRGQATRCIGRVPNYPQPVRIYVPENYVRTGQEPLALHFHGHNIAGSAESSHFVNGYGDFETWLANSGSRQLLVIPTSTGNSSTYNSLFRPDSPRETGENFNRFVSSLEDVTGTSFNDLALSGHSGAYAAIGALGLVPQDRPEGARVKQISGIGLFDAVYGRSNQIMNWANRLNTQRTLLYNLYAEPGSTTSLVPNTGARRYATGQLQLNEMASRIAQPRARSADETLSGVQIRTENMDHMQAMMNGRYTDFLRNWSRLRSRP